LVVAVYPWVNIHGALDFHGLAPIVIRVQPLRGWDLVVAVYPWVNIHGALDFHGLAPIVIRVQPLRGRDLVDRFSMG
jgi:hypothetical protein